MEGRKGGYISVRLIACLKRKAWLSAFERSGTRKDELRLFRYRKMEYLQNGRGAFNRSIFKFFRSKITGARH